MDKIEHPIQSLSSLIKALAFASILAIVILITAVLPAEYGIDPLGLGKKMGLTALAAPAEETNKAIMADCEGAGSIREDVVKLLVPAHSGLEYKFYLEKNAALTYSWKTDAGQMYFDFHGEPKGDTTGYFKSYKEETSSQDEGSKNMPFAGSHGWYWKNESNSSITVYLETKGEYQVIGLR